MRVTHVHMVQIIQYGRLLVSEMIVEKINDLITVHLSEIRIKKHVIEQTEVVMEVEIVIVME